MAITNKLITFNKLTSFETQLAQGNILETSIVFIKDAKKIWTKGTYFDCSGGGSNNIAVYETTQNIFDGIPHTDDALYPILRNANITTIVITYKESIVSHKTFVFNRIYASPEDIFSCIIADTDLMHKIYGIYNYVMYGGTGSIQILNKELALKSDIPNTDNFATQANLTSAVTQLTTNIAKKQDKFKINGRTINLDEDIEVAELDLGANGRYAMADGLVDGEDNYYSLPSNPDNYGAANILATKADVNAKKDTRNLTYSLNNSTSGTVTLLPNVCIYMPNVLTGKLAINACSTISSNNADLIESRICFRMPNNAALPSIQFNGVAIRWAGGNAPTFEADFTYEVSLFYPSNANSVGPMGVCVGFK